ncbi:Xaa-Pro aminopeptidase [Corallincola platygyrae]|uniref:Xaa-Pro aminopeptidase n=1 Tax=Corallincola platygyrae TaxID=1193278 RepID=A0ABW4XNL1_9GAMM
MSQVPSIPQSEFIARRQRFFDQMADNSVAVFAAAQELTRSRDTEFLFRQDSDFFYLTGFAEPDALLILSKGQNKGQSKGESNETKLLCRNKDKLAEIWQGRRLGPEAAVEALKVDEAFDIADASEQLRKALDGKQRVYFIQGIYPEFDQQILATLSLLRSGPKKGWKAPKEIFDARTILHEMRLIKSEAEIAVMREAGVISADAHHRAMRFAKDGATEYQLEAEIHHEFAMRSARSPAYGTIVGSGDNACILHYTENADGLKDGDLVLIDAGCELQGYAADITRTFPVSGKFSEPQRKLYQLVLDAQKAAMALVTPGNTIKQVGDKAIEVLTAGLIKLGILEGELETLIKEKAYAAYYMHGIGHWLGLDVHDVGEYKVDDTERPFEPGMVLTIEPGLYIALDAEVDAQWRGTGIRIEDNLLVTKSGHDNLTASAVKELDQVEQMMAGEAVTA